MMDCMMGMDCGIGMMIGMLLFWVLLIALIGWAFYRFIASRGAGSPPRDTTPAREPPLETLQRRYAEGEMSTEEYEERKHNLRE